MSYVRPAGWTQFRFWPAGRPPGYLCIGVVFGWPAGRLAVWLCLQLAKVLAGRPADVWLYLQLVHQLAKVLAGRPAGCLASWLAGTLARLVGLATWFRILVKVSAK